MQTKLFLKIRLLSVKFDDRVSIDYCLYAIDSINFISYY